MTNFRPIENKDIAKITALMQEFYAIDNYAIEPEKTKLLFETFIENKNLGKCWFIYKDKKIVGYVILTYLFSFEYQGNIAFLDELYIQESARGKGIGSQTIAFIKTEAKNIGLKLLYLEVENHNGIAQKLYLANDFVIHNRKIMKHKL